MNGFGSEEAGRLVMTVPGVNAAPVIDDNVRTEGTNHPHHIFKDLPIPDFLGFLGSFGETKIAGAGEVEFDTVATSGGQQFLCANETELRGLLWTESVLAAFAACNRQKSDIGVEAARKIGEDRSGFVVGMRGDIEDAGGHTCAVDGVDGFRKARAAAGSRRKLRASGREKAEAG